MLREIVSWRPYLAPMTALMVVAIAADGAFAQGRPGVASVRFVTADVEKGSCDGQASQIRSTDHAGDVTRGPEPLDAPQQSGRHKSASTYVEFTTKHVKPARAHRKSTESTRTDEDDCDKPRVLRDNPVAFVDHKTKQPVHDAPSQFEPEIDWGPQQKWTNTLDTESCGCGGSVVNPCSYCRGPRFRFFADAMYVRPGNIDLVYAVQQTGCDHNSSIPTGELGIVAPEFETGYRSGFGIALDNCNWIGASFTLFESHTADIIDGSGNNVLVSRVTHPNNGTCAANGLVAGAGYDIDFDFIDIEFRHTIHKDCRSECNILGGVRYAHLEQQFRSFQTVNADGTTSVLTDIDFEGIGLQLGMDGSWATCRGLMVYGRGIANFVGGETKADFRQTSQFGGSAVIASEYEDYRVLSILEAEAGFGWQSRTGRMSIRAGYQVIGWFDTITTADFIQGVHTSDFDDLGDLITFSGLVLRAEARF